MNLNLKVMKVWVENVIKNKKGKKNEKNEKINVDVKKKEKKIKDEKKKKNEIKDDEWENELKINEKVK